MNSLAMLRLQGLGLLVLAVSLLFLSGWSLITPVLDLRLAVADAEGRIARFETAARSASVSAGIDTSTVIAAQSTIEAYSLVVQRALVDDARVTGLQMNQLSAAPPRQMERGLVRLSYDLDVTGDLQHWTTFLNMLGDRRPALFLDKVALKSGPGTRADANLSMQIAVSSYLLPEAKND